MLGVPAAIGSLSETSLAAAADQAAANPDRELIEIFARWEKLSTEEEALGEKWRAVGDAMDRAVQDRPDMREELDRELGYSQLTDQLEALQVRVIHVENDMQKIRARTADGLVAKAKVVAHYNRDAGRLDMNEPEVDESAGYMGINLALDLAAMIVGTGTEGTASALAAAIQA